MSMKDYDAYLFDWDGTLVRANEMWMDLMRDQLEPYGIRMTDSELASKMLGRWTVGMHELGFSDAEISRLGDELDEAARARYPLANLYPYVPEMLAKLKDRQKKLALVTASWRNVIDIALTAHKLLDMFDVTVAGDEVRVTKPDPEALLVALEKLGVRPERALMLGDSPKDLLAANNAGTDSLLFFPPGHEAQHSRQELEVCRPTYTIASWQEMLNQVQ